MGRQRAVPRRSRALWLLFGTLLIAHAAGATVPDEAETANAAGPKNEFCYRCHQMETLGYLSPETGAIVDLHVDPQRFAESNHRRLRCVECHTAGYERYPHADETRFENLYCLDCHQDDERLATYRFPEIEREFFESVHRKRRGEDFTCFDCHDPHAFAVTRREKNILDVVAYDNGICLSCHETLVTSADEETPKDIESAHAWLPSTRLHWRHVRCLECHTPHDAPLSHTILAGDDSERNCVACHTTDSILLNKLYRFRIQEEESRVGFVNRVVFNDAYIIGMTRNRLLDRLSILLFAGLVLGLTVHGVLRWRLQTKRRS